MSIITKGANGRLIHGWTKEQADQEIEKGVLSPSDVIFLDSTNQIYLKMDRINLPLKLVCGVPLIIA